MLKVVFEEHKLYRSLVSFIWQRFQDVGPCQARRLDCVDSEGNHIYCTQVCTFSIITLCIESNLRDTFLFVLLFLIYTTGS